MHPVTVLTIGTVKKPFWQQAVDHYQRCLRSRLRLTLTALPPGRGRGPRERICDEEGLRILNQITPRHRLLALHDAAPARTSAEFARLLEELWDKGYVPCFAVGGPFGLAPRVLEAAWDQVSLGPMTLPHELALVVLLEQLYRASTILAGVAYHY
ncbi:MAG: hypothetical protein JG774_608 [Desulfomicrobiaceae bacterium]|jgi:23S rRNA (pseudouridine1915-N3)-methyltransferase|nr:hypothetical protein [Desulfomicrobiaceae bacterium]